MVLRWSTFTPKKSQKTPKSLIFDNFNGSGHPSKQHFKPNLFEKGIQHPGSKVNGLKVNTRAQRLTLFLEVIDWL